MTINIKNKMIPKLDVMSLPRHVKQLRRGDHDMLIDCVYCEYLQSWIFIDHMCLYKIKNNEIIQLHNCNKDNIALYNKINHIYIFHSDGYTYYDISNNSSHNVRFDKLVHGFSKLYKCIIFNDETLDMETNKIKMINVSIDANVLNVDNVKYTIPNACDERWYNFIDLNDYVVIELYNDFAKNWYLLFDKKTKTFGAWYYFKTICHIETLITTQYMIVYNNEILILSHNDFVSLFSGTSLADLHLQIDKGCESMIYYKNGPHCLDRYQKYLYYIYNCKLMATATRCPFNMHVLCDVGENVTQMYVDHNEIVVCYANLHTSLVTL